MGSEKQQFNVYLPVELVRMAKHRAIDEGQSLSDWVEQILRAYLEGHIAPAADLDKSPPAGAGQDGETLAAAQHPVMRLLPVIHVRDLPQAAAFYRNLGMEVVVESRDGDWVQLSMGEAGLGLLAHDPTSPAGCIELTFDSTVPLMELEARLRAAGVRNIRSSSNAHFGFQLQIEDVDGNSLKINQLDPNLFG